MALFAALALGPGAQAAERVIFGTDSDAAAEVLRDAGRERAAEIRDEIRGMEEAPAGEGPDLSDLASEAAADAEEDDE